ncbi:MAG: restriction endonuclease subunit S [Treponema sp.]|nr:restriction endonuclease subunit S [Treponema sp.]
MTEKKNIPTIRFIEFDGKWEEKQLNTIVDRVTRKNEQMESTLPLTISAQYGLIAQNQFFNRQIASKDVSEYFLIKKGEFAYNKSYSSEYPWGTIKRLDNYDSGVLSTLYIMFVPKNIDSDYIFTYYDTAYWYKEISKIAAEGARNHGLLNIAPVDFFNTFLFFPKSSKEQQNIGLLFQIFDSFIQNTQQKLDKTIALKKTMLERMFPKEECTVPELRFAGFIGDWEEIKLGDFFKKNEERNLEGIPVDKTISIATMKYNINGNGASKESLCAYKVIRIGDIAFEGHTNNEFRFGRFVLNDLGAGIMSPRFSVLRPKVSINTCFWKYYIHFEPIMRSILVDATKAGTMMNELVITEVFEAKLLIPSEPEQEAIGTYFQNIDKLISSYTQELEKLKNLKKALLERMFV